MNVYATNARVPAYVKQLLIDSKGDRLQYSNNGGSPKPTNING